MAFLSLFFSAWTSSGSLGGVYDPKKRSGDVAVPARRETMEYDCGFKDGVCVCNASSPESERVHLEMENSRL